MGPGCRWVCPLPAKSSCCCKVVGAGESTCTSHPSLCMPPIHPSSSHPSSSISELSPGAPELGGTQRAPCPALAEGVVRGLLEMGDASLPSQLHPNQAPVPRSSPSSLQCPRAGAGPGHAASLRDHAGHMAGAAPALLTRIRATQGGREQLGCHGGEEAAEGETFPGREESVGDAGRGCRAPRGRGGGEGGGKHLCTLWRWRSHICLSIDGAGGKETSSPLHPYGC